VPYYSTWKGVDFKDFLPLLLAPHRVPPFTSLIKEVREILPKQNEILSALRGTVIPL
jgi:hypothetical protein